MTTTKWLAAAALVTATIATPALAQDRMSEKPTRAEIKAQAKQDRMAKRAAVRIKRDRDDRAVMRDDEDGVVARRPGYAYNDGWNNGYWRQSETGFWPGDIAANIVGGAVATAGAIATAPVRGYDNTYAYYGADRGWGYDSQAYNNDIFADRDDTILPPQNRTQARANNPYASPYNNGSNASNSLVASYGERNGFVCTPGTYFKAQNGRMTLCQ